jgi:hypothetical protein
MVLPSGNDPFATLATKGMQQAMTAAWAAYHGNWPDPLKVKPGQPSDLVKTNRCKPIVDKGVAFLFGQDVTIEVVGEEQAQAVLDAFWKLNRQMTTLAKLAMNGAVCGHAFAKIIPADPAPRLVALNPQSVTVVTAPDDCDTVMQYCIEYDATEAGKTITRRQVFTRIDPDGNATQVPGGDRTASWIIQHWFKRDDMRDFAPDGPSIDWTYWWPPIVDCQNLTAPNVFWGEPDLTTDLIDLNKTLNFIQSNTSRIIKNHAHPKTFAKGISANQLDLSVDGVIAIPNPNASIENIEMQSDLASSMNFAESLRTDMDELSRVPAVATGRMANVVTGNISGIALELLFQPLIEKTHMKQRLYGEMIEEICCCVLDLAGMGYDHEIKVHWPHLLPVDETGEAQKAMLWEQLGVSQDTALRALGFDPEVEKEKRDEENQAEVDAFAQGKALPKGTPIPPPGVPLSSAPIPNPPTNSDLAAAA